MPAKRHHYVTRSYLAAFTDPETPAEQEPYLWVYERAQGDPQARAPHKVAVRSHYYSFSPEPGKTDQSVEGLLSRVESGAIPPLRTLSHGADPASLSEEEKGWLSFFIGLMSVRVPAFRDSVGRFAADLARRVALLGAQNAEYFERTMRKAYESKGQPRPENIEEVRRFVLSEEYDIETNPAFSLGMMMQLAPAVAKYVASYHWRVLRAPPGTAFVTSDRPLVLVSTEPLPGPHGWGTGWETPWMEATLPLSPDTCLLISLHHPEGVENVDAETVEEINLRTASLADEAVYSSRKIDAARLNRPEGWTWWRPVTEALVRPSNAGD